MTSSACFSADGEVDNRFHDVYACVCVWIESKRKSPPFTLAELKCFYRAERTKHIEFDLILQRIKKEKKK